MKIQMPQRIDMVALITAYLAGLETRLRGLRPRTVNWSSPGTLKETLTLEEAPQRSVGGHGTQKRFVLYPDGKVVGVKLVAPTGMLMKLEPDLIAQLCGHGRMLTPIRTGFAPERAHRVTGLPQRRIIPPFEGGASQVDPLAADRMPPLLSGQLLEL
jgi:hypothetical protein